MTCFRQPRPFHTTPSQNTLNTTVLQLSKSYCDALDTLPHHPRSTTSPTRSMQIPVLRCPSRPKPILTHEAHNVAAMRPRRLNHSASRAAEVRLQRVLAACGRPSGPSGTRAKANAVAWMEDAPLFQVLSGHGCLSIGRLLLHRGCKMCNILWREGLWKVDTEGQWL
jgi:hypothetical protein